MGSYMPTIFNLTRKVWHDMPEILSLQCPSWSFPRTNEYAGAQQESLSPGDSQFWLVCKVQQVDLVHLRKWSHAETACKAAKIEY